MAKADNVTIKDRTFYAQVESFPAPYRSYISKSIDSTVEVYQSIHKIGPSATNEVILVTGENTLTKETWLYDLEGGVTNDLTVKTNGDPNHRHVQPLRVISGRLTSLTVTNNDTVNPKYLGIIRIIPSSSTDITLVEEVDN